MIPETLEEIRQDLINISAIYSVNGSMYDQCICFNLMACMKSDDILDTRTGIAEQ